MRRVHDLGRWSFVLFVLFSFYGCKPTAAGPPQPEVEKVIQEVLRIHNEARTKSEFETADAFVQRRLEGYRRADRLLVGTYRGDIGFDVQPYDAEHQQYLLTSGDITYALPVGPEKAPAIRAAAQSQATIKGTFAIDPVTLRPHLISDATIATQAGRFELKMPVQWIRPREMETIFSEGSANSNVRRPEVLTSSDGSRILVFGWPFSEVWDVKTRQRVGRVNQYVDLSGIPNLVASHDGRTLAGWEDYGKPLVYVYDVAASTRIATISIDQVQAAGISPDGKSIVVVHHGGIVEAWDITNGTKKWVRQDLGKAIEGPWGVAYSSDGTVVWVGGKVRSVFGQTSEGRGIFSILESESGKSGQPVKVSDWIRRATISRSGKLVAVSLDHGGIIVYRLADMAQVNFPGGGGPLQFSQDEQQLADGASVWELRSGKEIARFVFAGSLSADWSVESCFSQSDSFMALVAIKVGLLTPILKE